VIEGHDEGFERSAAGPVVGGDPPANTPEGAPPTPPAGDALENSSSGPADPATDTASGEQLEQDFDALLADTQQERNDYLELAKRTQADFENYRKRMAAEVQAASVRGKAGLALELVGVIDNLERALAAAGIDVAAEEAPAEPLAQGILLTYRELNGVLTRGGVEAFDPKDEKFDPASHEALSTLAVEGVESGTVVEVLQKGYRLGEQLIRPARVVVSE
jgi:molecular chaperone GrpE